MEIAKIVPLFVLLASRTSGYTSTVVHLPHQQASSAVQFDLTQSDSLRSQRQHQLPQNAYQSTNYIKSTFPQNDAQPQLFNLGYSVRFEQNQQAPQAPQRLSPKMHFVTAKLNQGDIITGTRKQNVQIDLPSSPNQEPTHQTEKDIQNRKILGMMKLSQMSSNPLNTKALVAQANFSPTTQRNLEALENIQDNDYQEQLADLYQQKYTWRNLSPNVKIIKSTEVPSPSERIENRALVFDHAKALSKSEGFGFSDAIQDDNARLMHQGREETRFNRNEQIQSTPSLESYRIVPVSEEENESVIRYDHQENAQDNSPSENFRTIQVSEQINESPLKTQIANTQPYSFVGNSNQDDNQGVTQAKPQIKTNLVQIVPATIFQTVDGTPLKSQPVQQEMITQHIPKQVVIQHLKLPYSQYNSFKKFPGKIKYVKQIPISGNLRHKMKVVSSIEYPRKARIKPELRRDFVPPSAEYEIYV